ncbi:MAG: hypothetical protein P1S60_15975, partial [Anaerolineae bacterium]|nr:hypothetical protein [Anaerolineae bacterium]
TRHVRDIAPCATIEASSAVYFNDQTPGLWVPMIARAGVLLWDWPTKLEAVALYLRNHSSVPQPIVLTLSHARREPTWKSIDEYELVGRNDLRDDAFEQIWKVTLELVPDYEGWFRVNLPPDVHLESKDAASDDDRLLIAVGENRKVSWALSSDRHKITEMVEQSHYCDEWRKVDAGPTVRLFPPPLLGDPANITDGFHRRFSRGPTHMWMSDPEHDLPQDITLSWTKPHTIDEIRITFDNLTELREDQPWENGSRISPFLVKSYEVAFWDEKGWHELLQETCNIHRFCKHSFMPIQTGKVRLRILATHGVGEPGRVYQVQVMEALEI